VVKRRRKKADAEDNLLWEEYFHKIRGVCPWSWSAWQRGKISIQSWQGVVEDLGTYEARVYVHTHASSRLLNKLCDRFNELYDKYEFLWSHTRHGGDSAPKNCIIQQDHAFLNAIRTKMYK